jgi:hypothetical protein
MLRHACVCTNVGTAWDMYRITFRILETADEYFYQQNLFNYHRPLYGLALSDEMLKKIYGGNAGRIMGGGR